MVRQGTLRVRASLVRIIGALPIALPVGLAAFSAVAMLLLVLNAFYLPLLLCLGLPAAAGAIWLTRGLDGVSTRPGTGRERARMDALVVLGIVLWAGMNLPFSAQHILTNRDPATYAVAGAWLAQHTDLHIPKPALSVLPGVTADSLGFGTSALNPGEVYVQGAHLLPALLGAAGKVVGMTAMLHFNVLFGAMALLAFYGFARFVLRPKWAALATGALAASLPLIYFSRDTYTEPLTLMLVFSTLTLLLYGQRTQHARAWLLAGVTAGATALLRVDAYVFLASIEAYLLVYVALAPQAQRFVRLGQALTMAMPAALLGVLGWTDVSQLSSGYYRDLHPEIIAQFICIGLLTAVTAAAIVLAWRTNIVRRVEKTVGRRRVQGALWVAIGLFFAVLAARAFWLFAGAMTGRADTMPVEAYAHGTTLLWLLWYIGPVLTVAGIAGFTYGWTHMLRGRAGQLLPLFSALGADCALYLLNPNISADQVWASRRFLPVIFPAFIFLGTLVMQHASQRLAQRRLGPLIMRRLVLAGALVALLGPSLTSLPFWTLRPFAELSQTQALCRKLPENAVVVWVGDEGGFATQPTQVFCGVPSLSATVGAAELPALAAKLQVLARVEGRTLYLAANVDEASVLSRLGDPEPLTTLTYAEPEHTYKKFPIHTVSYTESILLLPLPPDTLATAVR